ncbi:hypothetical protein E4U58_003994 [Claviceps cyperi]|nr:hypothetical protein E4U58_003994 [Claviceps cyperi]
MTLWPFRRKSVRKRSRAGAMFSDNEVAALRAQADAEVAVSTTLQPRSEPAKLQRRQRAYSFSPGRHDSIRIERTRGNVERQQPDSGNAGDWGRTPTLHLTRRKSSKRRREDHDREAEIRAMSAFMPVRLATNSHGRSCSKQSTKRAKTGGGGIEPQQAHSSLTSLPYPNLVPSILPADSDVIAYKLSVLGSLAPRPTLKYSSRTRPSSCCRAAASGVSEHAKQPLGDRDSIQKNSLDSRERIDHLADDLGAKDLRELMERDNRRRERKRAQDQERLQKRLSRRVECTKKEEAEARMSGSPPHENLERGVMGRELAGLGIEPASAVITSSKRRECDTRPESPSSSDEKGRTPPLEVFHRPGSSPTNDEDAPAGKKFIAGPAEIGERVSALPEGSSRLSDFLYSKKSRSKSTLESEKDRLMDGDSGRKDSESSTTTPNRLSFTSLLKWGSKTRRHSGPSSFFNTSREETATGSPLHTSAQSKALAKLQGIDTPQQTHRWVNLSAAAAPRRTKSRFREDLPDFPISPPDSRVQSPEADSQPLPTVAESPIHMAHPLTPPRLRYDDSRSAEKLAPMTHKEPKLAISLASIDSEGSWLSGRVLSSKVPKKVIGPAKFDHRDAADEAQPLSNAELEDLDIAGDECLLPLAAGRNPGATTGSWESERPPSSSDENLSVADDYLKWGSVGAKPQVVRYHHHLGEAMRSRQGLLNIDSGDD